MNVSAAESGSPNLDPRTLRTLAVALANIAETLPLASSSLDIAADSVSLSLGDLAAQPIQHLLQAVEETLAGALPQEAKPQHAGPTHALNQPAPVFQSSQPEQAMVQTLDALTSEARISAEKSVVKASHAIEMAGDRGHRGPPNLEPRAVLALANQFIETGQLPNYLRAAELGRVVLSWCEKPAPAPARSVAALPQRQRESQSLHRFQEAVIRLWRRAPMLVLLAGWLLAGLIPGLTRKLLNVPAGESALEFDIWATGFLVLVVFQFIVTIRGFTSRMRRPRG